MFSVSIRLLRQHGTRLAQPPAVADGYLKTDRIQGVLAIELRSTVDDLPLAGPLFEPRVIKATQDGFILLGFTRDGEAAYVQEWSVGLPRLTSTHGPQGEVPFGPR